MVGRRVERRRTRRREERKEKQENEDEGTTQFIDESKTWGNDIILEKKWPKQRDDSTIKIVHNNGNGIRATAEFTKWVNFLVSMNEAQADIICLNEMKLDTRNSMVQFRLREI